jgi:hypothetical protein
MVGRLGCLTVQKLVEFGEEAAVSISARFL